MRKVITPKLRFQVLNRDNFTCQYCWLKAKEWVQLQVDHITPVSKWWETIINNLITSCFECNIWKWKNEIKEIKEKIYETKISETIKQHLTIFYNWWNDNNLWLIDNNTKALLNILVGNELWGTNYCSNLNLPWLTEKYIWKSFKELDNQDLNELNNLFKEWWEYCDDILSVMETTIWITLNTKDLEIENSYLWNELLINDYWKKDSICYDSYNYRLNHILTEYLDIKYKEWELKNNFSIKKFSYFYNQISNG